jgi:DNA-directed RNA polymerase beta' subunit
MVTKNTQVYNGDMFERDLQDGDYVSYNRSPSLLPTYMAGFKVKITEESVDTIQMNILTCNLVNADFDGDAMCMFYPNNSSSRAELKYLNGIQQMVVNIQNSKLNVKIAEECVVGLFKLSISTIYKQELKYLTENLDKYTTDKMYAELPEVFSGLDVISKLLPKNLNYCGKTNFYSENIH